MDNETFGTRYVDHITLVVCVLFFVCLAGAAGIGLGGVPVFLRAVFGGEP